MIRFAAHTGANAVHLIGGKADADASAAYEYAAICFSGCYEFSRSISADGIVEALGTIGAHINDLVPFSYKISFDFILHVDGNMIVADCKFHFDDLLTSRIPFLQIHINDIFHRYIILMGNHAQHNFTRLRRQDVRFSVQCGDGR